VLTPGPRVAAVPALRVAFVDGVPVAPAVRGHARTA
jgi:hypothetical protein